MSFKKLNSYTKEDFILIGTKAVSYVLNTLLIGVLIALVIGGVLLLINAILTPPAKKRHRADLQHTSTMTVSVSAEQSIIGGNLFIQNDSRV